MSRSGYSPTTNADLKDHTVPAMDVDVSEARATFETNFFAVINMCQTFLPLLIRSKGTIVQIGSVAGVRRCVPWAIAMLTCQDYPLCVRIGL